DATGHRVVPDLREPQRYDEEIRLVEQGSRGRSDILVVAERAGVVAMPELAFGALALEGPLELLAQREGVDHSLAESNDVAVVIVSVLSRQDCKFAPSKPGADVLGKTASKGRDSGGRTNDRSFREPAVQDMSNHVL